MYKTSVLMCGRAVATILLAPGLCAAAGTADREASSEEASLAEVVVTAERRSENLQRTAIAITQISGQELQQEGAVKLDDVINSVPGVKIIGGPAGYLVRIRGEGINIPPTLGDPSVPVMADGLYNAQVTTTFYGMYDIDHVEVLRGPQGTLFGKNSTGGVVNFITADPKQSVEGRASVGVGTYSLMQTEAMYNAPLSDKVALRIAGSTAYHDGYLSNGDNGLDSKSVRLKLLYRPTDAFSALLGVESSTNGGTPPGSVIGWGTGDPTATDAHGSSDPWYDPAPGGNFWRAKYQRYWLQLTYDLGWADLSVLPSAQNFDIKWRLHFAPGGSVAAYQASPGAYQTSDQHQYATEVHLASPSSQKLKWLAGLYYYNTPDWEYPQNTVGSNGNPVIDPAVISYTRTLETMRDYAAFAQATIPLSDTFRLTLGGRVTDSKKTITGVNNQALSTPATLWLSCWNTVVPACAGATPPVIKTTRFTYKAGVEFDVAQNSMLYVQTASGFIAGAFNTSVSTTSPAETLTAYEIGLKSRFLSDTLQVNAELFNNEVKNMQTFYTLPNPYLNGTTITAPATVSQVVPASARSYGGEVEVSWLANERNKLDFTAAYLNAHFKTFANNCVGLAQGCPAGPPTQVRFAYNGSVLPQSPDWTLTAGYDHTFALQNGAKITAHAETSYHTSYFLIFNYRDFPPYSSPPPFPANEAEVPAAHTSNASLHFSSPTEKWSLTANVKNIENTATKTGFFGPSVQVADPRTFSLILAVKF
jgi:iron complex outermembrane receptor protein